MDTSRHDHALLAALLACALASAGSAQPTTPQGSYDYVAGQEPRVSTTMIALLVAVVAVFLFIAVSTIYLRHCTGYDAYATGPADRGGSIPADAFVSRRQRRPRGLDAEVLEMFPIMKYAEAKALRVGKVVAALECAVCLSEFEDEEKLRLLPKCSHAFHPECIGEWLASHVTCPVCRCNLDPNKDTGSDDELTFPAPVPSSTSSEIAVVRQEDGAQPAAVVIDVVAVEEEEEERRKEAMELQQIGTKRRAMRSRSGRRPVTAQLVRWHSTGHSLAVRLDRDLERFTLRLPEHVRREMIASGEMSSRRGRRAGEGSSRGGRLGRSGRWPSFLSYTRTLSGRLAFFTASRRMDSSDGGEVSSSSSSTRIKGKRVGAVDVADGSAKGVVRLDRIGGSVSGAKVGAVAVDVEKATSRQVRT